MNDTTRSPKGSPASAGSVFVIAGLRCEVRTNKRQERRLERMGEPYSPGFVKWNAFVKELEAIGAYGVDHEVYGGLSYSAPDEQTGRAIAEKAIELLNKPNTDYQTKV